jgi:V/A-type H+-transporting ATPase subunit I
MAVGLIGVIVLAAALALRLPGSITVLGWAALAVGLVVLALSMGKTGFFLGPIEFVGVIGNVLSYLRLAALGLASVFLAKVANDMSGMVGSAIAGVLVALVIHALNLVMGMLSPTIQSLRLQYVEFFRKFYEGGQSAFTPFARRVQPAGRALKVKPM